LTTLEIGADLWRFGQDFNFSGDKQQWGWAGRGGAIGLAYPALRGANQLINASGALAALEALRDRLPITAQAVRNGLAMVELLGASRCSRAAGTGAGCGAQPALGGGADGQPGRHGFFPTTHAVFGAMADKDWLPCWRASAPRGPLVLLRPAHAPGRICGGLAAKWNALQMVAGGRREVHCSTHANPADALQAALVQADPADRIVVFGSFYTVGGCCWTACPDCRPSTWPDTAF
jgi:dihydrofolate synthase/folylpolyglutamate synthase